MGNLGHLYDKKIQGTQKLTSGFRKALTSHYLIVSLLWIICMIVVNPFGEFPLNDDWAYCKDVKFSLESGHLQFVNWPAMTLVSQILLGSFFCKIFGFSFTLLRILTSIVGLIGIITSYQIFKEYTSNNKLALFISLLIAGNPLFFSLSNTFMTDVYFFTFSLLSIFFFNRGLISDKIVHIFLATVFAVIATLTRQIGIVIPISFALISLYKSRSFILRAWWPLFIVGISLGLYNYWLSYSFENLTSYFSLETAISTIGTNIFPRIFYRVGTTGMTLGLFLFPLLIILLPHYSAGLLERKNRWSLFCTVLFIIPMIRAWTNIPLGNIFNNLGLGPRLLRDASILQINNYPVVNNFSLNVIRSFCFAGGLLLFYYSFRSIFDLYNCDAKREVLKEKKIKLFCLIIVMLFFGTFVIPTFFFDRYLIQLLFPLVILILPSELKFYLKSKTSIFAISLVFIFTFFTVGLTHDYLSWNRARWQGLNYLMSDLKISPHVIDGGFEFNTWYETAPVQNVGAKSWWYVDKDDYILTFGPLPDYKIFKKIPFRQYVPLKENYVYILYRDQPK